MSNIHHLELFYYVARYGGLNSAVRQMPYGIRQPTLSIQLRQLEDQLGHTLLQRRPFRLTAAGERLYAFVRPLFDNLPGLPEALRGIAPQQVRLGGAPILLRDYLPPMLGRVRRRFPRLRLVLKEGPQAQIEQWFESEQIDLAILEINGPRPRGCRVHSLLKLPVVLLVNEASSIRSAEDLWNRDASVGESWIGPWPQNVLGRAGAPEPASAHIHPNVQVEVNSIELVEHYVRHGHGIGASIAVPGRAVPQGLRALPLPGVPCVEVGALWRGALNPPTEALLHELQNHAKALANAKGP